MILVGPPGTGKTTSINALARQLLGESFKKATLELNASDDRGLEAVREKIKSFAAQKVPLPEGKHKIIILDEADSMTENAQQALRIIISDFSHTTRFALACNDSTKIIEPIQSRCNILRYSKLKTDEIRERLLKIIEIEAINCDEGGLNALIETAEGDMRFALNNLQSTFVGFNTVTADNVYKIVDIPKPEMIRKIFDLCAKGELDESLDEVDKVLSEGYNALDIVSVIIRILQDNSNINDDMRMDLLKESSLLKMRILEGIDSEAQIYGFISEIFSILNKKI
jgi:replication factor C subunit 2/4